MYWGWLDFKRGAAWGDEVVRTAVNLRRSTGRYAAVISSGPPHMSHDTGRRVAEAIGAPFVMDMRDPWSCAERLGESVASPYWLAMAGRYERRAVERAMLVVANTDVARDALRAKYPARRNDIITVMNGADDDPLPPPVHAKRFSIAHAGTIYLDRDPRPLFRAAARVIAEFGLTPEQFGLDFIGDFSGVNSYPVQAVAREEGIEQYVTVGPSLPYAKAMEFMAGATMLVTMSGGSIAAIPAKTFECVRFEAWLLAMTAPESATARLLQGTGADVVSPADTEAMTAVLRQRYQQHAQGERPPEIGRDGRFSRRRQAAILFDALDERMAVSKG
jgi:hypothetical protein